MAVASGSASDLGLSPTTFAPLLRRLVLTPDQFTVDDVRAAMLHLTSPDGATAAQMSAFLTALKLSRKDSEPDVVAECARVMRSRAVPFVVPPSEQGVDVCDIVGTGGDGHNTFNVSTSAALVAAGAGCRVHKHGNRAATSSSGSADILISLGCPVHETTPPRLAAKADQSPFLFLFAPSFHPAMARIAPVRKELAFPTVFNLLGPLINPAAPSATVVGVHSRYLGHLFAESLRLMAVRSAWVVCGNEGLDELSPAGPSHVWQVRDGEITEFDMHPADFGLREHSLDSVKGGTPSENARTLVQLLDAELGHDHPIENFVVLNAAALLMVAGKACDPKSAARMARDSIQSGRAKAALGSFATALSTT